MAMEMKLHMAVCMLIALSLFVSASAHADVAEVRDVENPARTPFVVNALVDIEPSGLLRELGRVPAGKRAVIEFISMVCSLRASDTIHLATVSFEPNSRSYFLPISKQGDPFSNLQNWVAGQLVRIYADEGRITLNVLHAESNPGLSSCEVSISGHTIDVN